MAKARVGFFAGDVERCEIARAGGSDQACAPDDRAVAAEAAPQIGEIDGVERAAFGVADLAQRFFGQWGGQCGEREARRALPFIAGQRQRQGVGGEEDFFGANHFADGSAQSAARERDLRGRFPDDRFGAAVFVNGRAVADRGAREARDHFAGIERTARDFLHHAQRAGIFPGDG